jgi:hypothetical protein
MTFNAEQKQQYAAILSDTEYAVEFGLYPLPQNAESLTLTLQQLGEMPHTPEEANQIRYRLGEAAKAFLSAEELATAFGDQTLTECADPVEIQLTKENYGLVYPAVQVALDSLAIPTLTAVEGESEARITSFTEALDARIQTRVEAAVETLKGLIESRSVSVEFTAEFVEQLAEKVRNQASVDERVTDLETQLQESETARKASTATLVAFYMTQLRKPLARGKSREELEQSLATRTLESLQDSLADLCAEFDAGGAPAGPLPKLQDPTQPGVTETEEAPATPLAEAAPQTADTDPEKIRASELPQEEGEAEDIIQILFPSLQ